MELTLDQIHTYLHCPLKYQIRHEQGVSGGIGGTVFYKEAVHKAISYFYFSLMGERMPTPKQMKDKWAYLWAGSQTEDTNDFLLKERQYQAPNKHSKLNTQGFEMIHNFYHMNKDDPGIPIAVDHEYRVPIANVMVVGNFELIREKLDKSLSTRFIEIVDFKTGNDAVDPFLIKHDMNLSIASYAFQNLFQSREDRLTYYYLKTGKEIYTQRDDSDFARLEKTVHGVAEGIAKKHFYPNHNFMCKSCPVKDVCGRVKFN